MIERFSLSEAEYNFMKDASEKEKHHLSALEVVIKTMRKTECWGRKGSYSLNFEWPAAQDLLQMLKSNPIIKVVDLKYKPKSNNNGYFGGFQLILSNG